MRLTTRSPLHSTPFLLLGSLLALLTLSACDGPLTVTVSQEIVQDQVARAFPQEHDMSGIATLTLKNPVVDLGVGEGRIGLLTDIELSRGALPLVIKGKARTSGLIRYEPSNATFYMTDVRVDDLDLAMKLLSADRKKQLLDGANTTLQLTLKDLAIYQLSSSAREKMTNALLRDVRVEQSQVVLTLGPGK